MHYPDRRARSSAASRSARAACACLLVSAALALGGCDERESFADELRPLLPAECTAQVDSGTLHVVCPNASAGHTAMRVLEGKCVEMERATFTRAVVSGPNYELFLFEMVMFFHGREPRSNECQFRRAQ